MIFLELFLTFFIIGLFTIGGGYAMLPLIQHKVCMEHAWITEQRFTDIVAISQMTPGPIGINSATYIGYTVIQNWTEQTLGPGAGWIAEFLCVLGSFTATFAVVIPSFLIVLSICKVYTNICHSYEFNGIMKGLRPTIAGLIGAAAVIMIIPENFPDWKSWLIFAASFALAMFSSVSPILILAAAGVAGFLLY